MKKTKPTFLIIILLFIISILNPFMSIAQTDIKVISFTVTPSQGDTTCMNTSLTVSFDYTNLGTDTVFMDTVRYSVNTAFISTENWSGSIAPGDTNTFVFARTFNCSLGPYSVEVESLLSNDTFPTNNSVVLWFYGVSCTGIDYATEEVRQVITYPNPATSQLNLEIGDLTAKESGVLSIFNNLGQEVAQLEIAKATKTLSLDIEDYPKGIYYIRIQTKDNIVAAGKFIKE